MKKFSIIANSIIMAMSMVGMAHAKLNNWTGMYAGVNGGFSFSNVQIKSQQLGFTNPSGACYTNSNYSTFYPGLQVGYMYQFPGYIVSGVEVNGTINTSQQNTLGCTSNLSPGVYDRFSFRNQMQSSIKGRLGRALNWNNNNLLPYLTAGASFANLELKYYNEGGNHYSQNTTQSGWLIGAGVEWAFWKNWSLRAEYTYLDYGDVSLNIPSIYGLIDPNGGARAYLSSNNVAVAVNYWI